MAEGESAGGDKPDLQIGSYQLIEPLGTGGMSSVYRARHVETGHEVAVKILPRSLAKNATMLQRFLREAKSAEALEHPNIVTIYDRGVDQGRHYLVLEYVAGGDLHDRVRNDGPLEIGDAVGVIRAVCEGLKFAAERGLIHRDIKPANLLVSPKGEVKIIDLGLALKAEGEDERVTRDGTTVGTVDYMAPEQARDSRATSVRSDIYSLGCTFYYLLTGGAPFAGGDIAEKLRRHFGEPPPDPCEARPTIPKSLSAVIRKMMAKRAENRYQNYDELLAALRSGPLGELRPGATLGSRPDVEIEGDEIPLAPIESGVGEAVVAGMARGGDPGAGSGVPLGSGVDLAELEEPDAAESTAPRHRGAATPHSGKGNRAPREAVPEEEEPGDEAGEEPGAGIYDDDEEVEDLGGAAARVAQRTASADRPAMMKWVYAGIGATVGLLVVIFLIKLMIPSNSTPSASTGAEETTNAGPGPEPEPAPAPVAAAQPPAPPPGAPAPAPASPAPQPVPAPTPQPPAGAPTQPGIPGASPTAPGAAAPKTASPAPVAPAAAWVEPADPAVEQAAETAVAADVAARFALPAWARSPVPQQVKGGHLLRVRRINDPGRPEERAGLAQAFEAIGNGTIELIDDGPLADSDFRLRGDVKLLRAVPGRRPIIRLEPPRLDVIRNQGALFLVEGKQLTLDGLDLIVDLGDLPRQHTALFLCKGGGTLTLNNCTITVINPQRLPFTVVRAQGNDRPAQVRLEKCFLRGGSTTMVEFIGGSSEVVVVRSVFAGGQGPLIVSTTTTPGGDRKLHVQHSVLAGRGAILELTSPVGARPTPVAVRALATTFARFRTDEPASLIFFHDDVGGEAKDFVNWQGEQNVFIGWNDWASMGNGHAVKVASLAAARTTWAGTDALSQESPTPWPIPPDFGKVLPEQMKSLAPQSLSTLVAAASPSAFLYEKTIETFVRPEVPNYVSPIPNEVQEGAGFVPGIGVPPPGGAPPFAPPRESAPPPGFSGAAGGVPPGVPPGLPPGIAPGFAPGGVVDPNAPQTPGVKELLFDVLAKPWSGNLGLYLQEQLKPGDQRARVRVAGTGKFNCTPVRIPDGLSLEIVVETARQSGAVPPEWTPLKGAPGEVLFDIKGGDLTLTGVELARDGSARLKALVRAEDSHLVLNHCRLRHDPRSGKLDPNGGNLIIFRAATTRPLGNRPNPFDKPFDKPTCRIIDSVLITSGDVITAELGRGMISLNQCAVAGGNVFVLAPAKVARSRFDADLSIERSTLAAEKSFVTLGPWPGTAPGPDRPWLVSSRDSAYMTSYVTPPPKESVLLKVEPNSLAQGALFWQGNNDAYEVTNFTARSDKAVAMNTHPDVFRNWISIWGPNHFRNATGPTARAPSTVRLRARLKAGNVTPGELELDPNEHPGRTELDLGVDLRRLQVTPGPERPTAAQKRKTQ
jgi:serine/threonine-protein kinase